MLISSHPAIRNQTRGFELPGCQTRESCRAVCGSLDMQIDPRRYLAGRVASRLTSCKLKFKEASSVTNWRTESKGDSGAWLEPRIRPPSMSEWQDGQANNVITLSVPRHVEIRCSNVCTRVHACQIQRANERCAAVLSGGIDRRVSPWQNRSPRRRWPGRSGQGPRQLLRRGRRSWLGKLSLSSGRRLYYVVRVAGEGWCSVCSTRARVRETRIGGERAYLWEQWRSRRVIRGGHLEFHWRTNGTSCTRLPTTL